MGSCLTCTFHCDHHQILLLEYSLIMHHLKTSFYLLHATFVCLASIATSPHFTCLTCLLTFCLTTLAN